MKAQHTPGPWTIDPDWGLIMSGEAEICAVHTGEAMHGKRCSPNVAAANRRLIAEAPAMLKALEECVTEPGAACFEHGTAWQKVEWLTRRLQAISDTARAAIAKAKGEA